MDKAIVEAKSGRRDPKSAEEILPLIYEELRRLASSMLALEKPGQTLQPTALVHEAYLRLVGDTPETPWDGRRHFYETGWRSQTSPHRSRHPACGTTG